MGEGERDAVGPSGPNTGALCLVALRPAMATASVPQLSSLTEEPRRPDGTVGREMVFELQSWARGLAPGAHRVEYTDFAGERYDAAFVVGAAPGQPVELRLRR